MRSGFLKKMVKKRKKNEKKAENPYIIGTGRKLFFLAGGEKKSGRAEKSWEQGRNGGRRKNNFSVLADEQKFSRYSAEKFLVI
jgi:hypothetical protein